tara:strand:- start:88 stop:876 length:789 start_codon:yes stop_codon:yes gene_type:complete
MKPWTTKKLRNLKKTNGQKLSMLTCYDFQTAQMLNESQVDLILVGDSLGNVILGYDTTVSVTLQEMIIFGSAVKRGAPNKFTVIDLPFGTYATRDLAIKNGLELFQKTKAESLKLEGHSKEILQSIELLTSAGVPIMGHLGLTPQSVHEQGGYFTHGKTSEEEDKIINQAIELENAGVFAIVLECVTSRLAKIIEEKITIPTIGIGSGNGTTGQVLVLNDLLGLGKNDPPSFCQPVSKLFNEKLKLTNTYIESVHQTAGNTQ